MLLTSTSTNWAPRKDLIFNKNHWVVQKAMAARAVISKPKEYLVFTRTTDLLTGPMMTCILLLALWHTRFQRNARWVKHTRAWAKKHKVA